MKSGFLELLHCPECGSGNPLSSDRNGILTCSSCRQSYPIARGFLDLCPSYQEKITPIQYLCQASPLIAIYDNVWRPFGYFFTSSRSFSEDLDRITALIEQNSQKIVLDLACGPGNFTRNIARYGRENKVVGLDLSEQMLERAVGLSPSSEYANVCYMRGNALAMPFESESFDVVFCCAALQLFTNYTKVLAEIARLLKPGGSFVCQTIVTRSKAPLWLRAANRTMKFGYFKLDDLKDLLDRLQMVITYEESSKVSYIFRAMKRNVKQDVQTDREIISTRS